MSIEQNNRLIAEFMGIKKLVDPAEPLGEFWDFQNTGKLIYSLRTIHLKYHTSWDWLMPVVEKIESGSLRDVFIYDKVCRIEDPASGKKWMGAGRTKIEAVYEALTEYLTTNSTTNEHANG